MTDIGFDGGQPAIILPCAAQAGKGLFQAIDLNHITDDSGRAMGLNHFDGVDRIAGHVTGFLDGAGLPVLIGGGNIFTLAVAGFAIAGDDGINGVFILNGIFEALENDASGALPHHKTIGPFIKGERAVRRKGVQGREVDESQLFEGHIGTAADYRIVLAQG